MVSDRLLGDICPTDMRLTSPIQTDEYRYALDGPYPGTEIVWVRGFKILDVVGELRRRLSDEGLVDEYFNASANLEHAHGYSRDYATPDFRRHIDALNLPEEWPRAVRWVACYAVTGDSEGHYVHVDLLYAEDHSTTGDLRRVNIAIGKTFKGWDHAWLVAKRCAELLGA